MRPRLRTMPEILHGGDFQMPRLRRPRFSEQTPVVFVHNMLRKEEGARGLRRVFGLSMSQVQERRGISAGERILFLPVDQETNAESEIHQRPWNRGIHSSAGKANETAGSDACGI